ncbi:MAG: phosphoserine phosphatase [Thermoplasmata archaeon]|nr:phosphoserine phosphatase [Thermoplasmata archaeon]
MPDAIEELERKRAESNARADEHRALRDKLNSEARALADHRAEVLDELRAQSGEAQDHRHHRDEMNEAVREEKRLREESNRRLQEVADRLQEVKRTKAPRPGAVPVWRLRKELKELEFRHMTSAFTPDQEKRIISDMQRLELSIKEQDDQMHQDPEIEVALTEMTTARAEAEEHHAAVGRFAEEAQAAHESMVGLYMHVDELRRQADEIQAKLILVKGNADEEHRAHIAAIEEVRDLEKMLYAARGVRPPMSYNDGEPPKEEDFLARLKKGEKVSTEDLLDLQKSGGRR